ncbi:MAG TPA: gluconeogenesis factor YvcK family protein [Armatimonadota bacterium]|nr:gluconeogenesis factor YvcK family protein [Armatimonadota bacterium]
MQAEGREKQLEATARPTGTAAPRLQPRASSLWQQTVTRLGDFAKWLRIGMRVKRWLLVALLGIAILVVGVDLMFLLQLADLGDQLNELVYRVTGKLLTEVGILRRFTYQVIIGFPTAILGLLVFIYGVRNLLVSVTSAVVPTGNQPIADVIWRRRQLAHGARIVVIGGGTGLSTLLRGLKQYTSNITAVVTVTDDGGSSGRLQREFGMLPPGDIRNCLVALADAEPLMQELFQYRFQPRGANGADPTGLQGHSFGNLLIAAMLHITGDFEEAVRQTSRVLAIRGRVLPSTTRQVSLLAELEDGTIVEGETNISREGGRIREMRLSEPDVEPLDETLEAIRTADAIVIGPGSVYTSLVPNFLVNGVAEAVAESQAIKLYVCNVMTQPGETTDFTASDHVRAILRQSRMPLFDYVMVNIEEPNEALRERYAGVGSRWVQPDLERIRSLGLRPITGRFISQSNVVRHDPEELAREIVDLINRRARPLFWALDRRD